VRASVKLLGASAAVAVLFVGASGIAQDAAKKPGKTKSACNAITEETACKADATCIWIGATTNAKTGKTRKAYCKSKPTPSKKKT